jgi:hypothetical protein
MLYSEHWSSVPFVLLLSTDHATHPGCDAHADRHATAGAVAASLGTANERIVDVLDRPKSRAWSISTAT